MSEPKHVDARAAVYGWREWNLSNGLDHGRYGLFSPREHRQRPWPLLEPLRAVCSAHLSVPWTTSLADRVAREPGYMERYRRDPCPEPPSENCRCGIYANTQTPHWFENPMPPFLGLSVFGRVALWGRVIDDGYGQLRGQFARPLVLYLEVPDNDERYGYQPRDDVREALLEYQVPLFELHYVGGYTEDHHSDDEEPFRWCGVE